jgi:PAS domain S-box-containing protein
MEYFATLTRELRAMLGRQESVLSAIADAIVWTDEEGIIRWCSRAFDQLVGLSHIDILGAELFSALPLEQHDRVVSREPHPLNTALNTRATGTGFYEFRTAEHRWALEIAWAHVQTEANEMGIVWNIRNVTLRKQEEGSIRTLNEDFQRATLNLLEDSNEEKTRMEETQRAILKILEDFEAEKTKVEASNKELEAFSYSVSHDLRTPLRAIDGFSRELLRNAGPQLDDHGKEDLQRIRKAAQRMGQLIEDLLNLSRLTRSEMTLEYVNLSAHAESFAADLTGAHPERRADFVIAPNLTARGDQRLLLIAMENLLSNAWKFTAKTPMTRIEFGITKNRGKDAFFVRDNGAGFDMARVGNLFGVFQRLHDARDYAGTGIGLATVKRIFNRHGGEIWAEAEVDQGATFYFTLS